MSTPFNNTALAQPEIIELGLDDQIPVAALLADLILVGIVTGVNNPAQFSATMDAYQKRAVLTTPVLRGPQGNSGQDAFAVKFKRDDYTDPSQLPEDLGDFDSDLGKFWVIPVIDPDSGEAIATTIYVWTGLINGIYSTQPGLGQGWAQLPVGTPGPNGLYPDLSAAKLNITQTNSGLGPDDQDSWVAVDTTDDGTPAAPLLTFNVAPPQGIQGPAAPLGSYYNIDMQTNPPSTGDALTCTSRLTPSAPTGLTATASLTGGALSAGTYHYVVTATLPNGETVASNEVSVTLTGTTSSVELSWNIPSGDGATGFNVYRGTTAGEENKLVAVIVSGTTSLFVDTGGLTATQSPPTTGIVAGKYIWAPEAQESSPPLFFTMPQGAFVAAIGIEFGQQQPTIGTYDLPPQVWPWIPFVFGQIQVTGANIGLTPLLIGCKVELGSPNSGNVVATGVGNTMGSINFLSNLGDVAATPTNSIGVVPANHQGNQGTLYVTLVNEGLLGLYDFNPTNATLGVLVLPVLGPMIVESALEVYAQAFTKSPTVTVT